MNWRFSPNLWPVITAPFEHSPIDRLPTALCTPSDAGLLGV
jgi:hypothetical protein